MRALQVLRIGPSCTVQDRGRVGYLGQGLSQGGAADTLALAEGAALLRQDAGLAALEMAGIGGQFEASAPMRIALTGAEMVATLDGTPLVWNASHRIEPGQRLEIGAAKRGVYGYLHVGGGFATHVQLGARAAHLVAALGAPVAEGDTLPVGAEVLPAARQVTGLGLRVADRFSGGELRLVESFQSDLFPAEVRRRFSETPFTPGRRASRMALQLMSEGAGFAAEGQLNVLSEIIVPGDVQMTGDGRPFLLLREAQTTGGYPRIGTVLPCDLSRAVQAAAGAVLRFRWVTLEEGLAQQAAHEAAVAGLPSACRPLLRDPADMADLLSYQLIGGVVSAAADPFEPRDEPGAET
ncbi:biotin-dependent carboxyltransferase family protein [Phaeobacter inhibens]|uniref:5-oxoprolinase subunit C family protein n=1 Tax=Phaeobacter inhibens TaxID=221822 RepID=UPI0021A2B653|nr:biotin-dependent carboxyltransferase family protein [Phaeobacter inhibens]UWS03386.1 biotin-dependent carboxyltransferase family protein [Phaeobacter inhibens]